MKRQQITKQQFQTFVNEHKKWVNKFGMFPWKMSYHLSEPSNEFRGAWNEIEWENQLCHIHLEKYYEKEQHEGSLISSIKRTAKHEALHLLTAPLYVRCMSRFVTREEITAANEDLIRRLEDLVQ